MAYSDRELLARLIQCEAGGEGDDGMKAVATVIMNRVRQTSGEYSRISQGGNLRNIVFQKGQFDCASETIGGSYNAQNLYNMRPEAIHYAIADWALAGNVLLGLGKALWFYNPYTAACRNFFPSDVGVINTKINQHCFYDPTQKYQST